LDEEENDRKDAQDGAEEEYLEYEDIPSQYPPHRSHGAMNGGGFMTDIEMMFGGSI
jgi:hypothetical protein